MFTALIFIRKRRASLAVHHRPLRHFGVKKCFNLKKFADLLLGVQIILRTDHRNLLFLNEAGSAKMTRWKITIQNYNFRIEYIPGVDNIPADAFSRLIKPHGARTVQLNVLTRIGAGGGNDVGQKGP
jgi:hypothetical protein